MKAPTWAERTAKGTLRIRRCLACGGFPLYWRVHHGISYLRFRDGRAHDASACLARQFHLLPS